MRLLTKAEACRELRLSLSTLNRRIAAGEVLVRREPRGRRHRVYVILDDDPPIITETPPAELAVARERIRDLEAQVLLLQRQLEKERQYNAGIVKELNAARAETVQKRAGPQWRLWRS